MRFFEFLVMASFRTFSQRPDQTLIGVLRFAEEKQQD